MQFLKNKKHPKLLQAIKNNFYIFRLIWRFSPSRIFWSFFVNFMSNVKTVFIAVFLFRLVLNGIQSGKAIWQVLLVIGVYFFISCLESVARSIYDTRIVPVTDQVIYLKLNNMMYEKAVSVEIACFENEEFYTNYTKASMEANTRAAAVLDNFSQVVTSLFGIFSVMGVLATLDKYVFLFCIFPFIGNLIVAKQLNKLRYSWDMDNVPYGRQKDYVKRTVYLQQYAKEIRLNRGITGVLLKKYFEAVHGIIENAYKYGVKVGVYQAFITLLNIIIPFFVASVYSAYCIIETKTMQVGDFTVIAIGVMNLSSNAFFLINLLNESMRNSLYIDNLRSFLNYEPKIKPNSDGLPAPDMVHKVVFKNVTFKYENSERYVLNNLNFEVRQGEKIAIVGHNGAGKSTLIKLLLRLYEATGGEIRINGQNISSYRLDEYRAMFGVVFQDYRLFATSVAENILMHTADEAELESIQEALDAVGMSEKVSSMKNGAETIVTREFDENGAMLSGGEQQKLALARLFIRPSPILLLDEPSSALDPIAEQEMFDKMLKIASDKTVFFISHRLSSATSADRIIFMEQGEIKEMGTHTELMQLNGSYADIFHKQAEAYAD